MISVIKRIDRNRAVHYDITVTRGDTAYLDLTAKDADGSGDGT